MNEQIDITFPPPPPVTIPGQYGGEPVFGDVCPPSHCGSGTVATSVYRYLRDSTGKQTGYIRREKGRPVKDIAADLSKVIKGMNFEWDTLGQPFKYKAGDLTPETECPEATGGLCVYARHGGSEGHVVCVELIIQPKHDERGGDGTGQHHMTLFMVKTFAGAAYATRIANKLAKALGVY